MICTETSEGIVVQFTWTEARTLIAAINTENGYGYGIDDDDQEEMLTLVGEQQEWLTELVTALNDALAKAGKQPWAKDPC